MLESQQKSEHTDGQLSLFDDDGEGFTHAPLPAKRSWWRRNRWLLIIIVLLLVILVPVTLFGLRRLQPRTVYQFQQVTQGNLSLTVTATGPVQGKTYTADFLANGTISEIDVSLGQVVQSGQTLARLNATALQDALNQAQATLQQQKDYGTQDAINIAQDSVNTAQHNLNNATLKAPHSGTITAINGSVGGTPVNGASGFIQIVDPSSLQIQANINESDIGGIVVGQAVQFSVSAYSNRSFDGTVSAISPLGQSASNVVTYPVTINVDMKNLQGANVLPGMTANVTITTAKRSNVLLVPVNALNFAQSATQVPSSDRDTALAQAQQMLSNLPKSYAQDTPTAAYVLEAGRGRWIVKPVVLGLTDGTSYEVLDGLSSGETVAIGLQSSPQGGSGAPFGRPGSGPGGGGG